MYQIRLTAAVICVAINLYVLCPSAHGAAYMRQYLQDDVIPDHDEIRQHGADNSEPIVEVSVPEAAPESTPEAETVSNNEEPATTSEQPVSTEEVVHTETPVAAAKEIAHEVATTSVQPVTAEEKPCNGSDEANSALELNPCISEPCTGANEKCVVIGINGKREAQCDCIIGYQRKEGKCINPKSLEVLRKNVVNVVKAVNAHQEFLDHTQTSAMFVSFLAPYDLSTATEVFANKLRSKFGTSCHVMLFPELNQSKHNVSTDGAFIDLSDEVKGDQISLHFKLVNPWTNGQNNFIVLC
ncbi:hypothetical protein HDE_03525 [Halotydeus destructor]|nr:hypothetical protein HDE_03525 [Halotydeus destructor]